MVWIVDGHKYYGAAEACSIAGVSKDTYLRWVRRGEFEDVKQRDRHGWRLFTESDLARLKTKVNHIKVVIN